MLINEIKNKISQKEEICKNDNLELRFINNCIKLITDEYKESEIDIQIFQKLYEVKKNKVNNYIFNIKKLKRNLKKFDEDNEQNKEYIKKIISKIENYINNRSKNLLKFLKLKENYKQEYNIDFDKNEEIKNFVNNLIEKIDVDNSNDNFLKEIKKLKKNYKIKNKQKTILKNNLKNIKKNADLKKIDNNKKELNDNIKKVKDKKIVPTLNKICDSKNNIAFDESDKWTLKIEKLTYFPKFVLVNKIVVRFLNEDFFFFNDNEFGCLCKDDSTGFELNYDLIINYELNNKFNEEIYILIYHIGLYNDSYMCYENPIIWGFSIFHLNKENFKNELKKGCFEIPVFCPFFLKMDSKKFKYFYKLEKFTRYPLCSLKFYNKPEKQKSLNDFYKRFNFTLSSYEKQIQKIIFNQRKYNLLDYFKNLDEGCKLENLDDFLQLGESSILNFPYFSNYINEQVKIIINVKGLINDDESFSQIKIITDFFSTNSNGNLNKISFIFDKNSSFNNENIILLNDVGCLVDNINTTNDFFIFKIYKKIVSIYNKSELKMIGWSIIPIFYEKESIMDGDFVLPVICNNFTDKDSEKIYDFNPKVVSYLIAKNKFYDNFFIDNKFLIVNIKNFYYENLRKNKLPKVVPENFIKIFIPLDKLEEVNNIEEKMEEFSYNIEDGKLDNFNKKIHHYYINLNKNENNLSTMNWINENIDSNENSLDNNILKSNMEGKNKNNYSKFKNN